jgi:hypothetical protein
MGCRNLIARSITCLTPRPFLHLGRNPAGAQAQSRCSPPRRNDLDGAPAPWRAVRSDDCRRRKEAVGNLAATAP